MGGIIPRLDGFTHYYGNSHASLLETSKAKNILYMMIIDGGLTTMFLCLIGELMTLLGYIFLNPYGHVFSTGLGLS